jgi:octaprenyl-diphosphate synthase
MHEYTKRLGDIEAVLQRWLPENPAQALFPDIEVSPELAGSLTEPGRTLLRRGGKRWRPLLMTLVCESLGGADQALPLTPLVEFPHNASLIHDDIEDNSDERRGEPAIHLLYGTDTAINSGAFLYFLPLACIDAWDAPPLQKNRVFSLWAEHMRRLHLGQAMDIHWHRDFSSLPGIREYETMCVLKTGSLARLAAILGLVVSGADGTTPGRGASKNETGLIHVLAKNAEKLGMGFQILDDVRNLRTGNPGKKRGDDVVEGKKSLPVLLYMHRRPDRRDFTARCFAAARKGGTLVPEVDEFIAELEAAGVLTEAEDRGRSLIGEARGVFSDLSGSGSALLAGLLDFIGGVQEQERRSG